VQRLKSFVPRHFSLATLSLLTVFFPLCVEAAKSASIRLPDEFTDDAQKFEFEGFGGFNRGDYKGAEFAGSFTRIESRLAVFDPLYVSNRGKSSFTIESVSELENAVADCSAKQNVGALRIVTLDLKKLTYECEFSGSDVTQGWRFVLGEPKREGFREKLLARERRRGEAYILDEEFLIESVHEYEGSPLGSQSPLGYILSSGSEVVAAIDLLDWNPIVYVRNGITEPARRAAIVVALALAVLRDPANSALED